MLVSFSIEEHFSSAWKRFKKSSVFWICISLFSIAIGAPGSSFSSPNMMIVFTAISMYFSAAIVLMSINYMKGDQVTINNLIDINFLTFIHYFLVSILCGIVVFIGAIFLILPGLYLASRLIFAQYLVVDKKITFDQAIMESWVLTKGNEWNLINFLLVTFLVFITGFFALFVGLLVAIPVVSLATASLYLCFTKNHSKTPLEL
tara:strand:- start:52 stop:663 length:612 start_codon:yes stop_codon:yes gene_type:complete